VPETCIPGLCRLLASLRDAGRTASLDRGVATSTPGYRLSSLRDESVKAIGQPIVWFHKDKETGVKHFQARVPSPKRRLGERSWRVRNAGRENGIHFRSSRRIRTVPPGVDGALPPSPLPCARSAWEGELSLLALYPGRRLRLRYAPAGLALGWYGAAPLGRRNAALREGEVRLGAGLGCSPLRGRILPVPPRPAPPKTERRLQSA
jgi:hypothetical protein